MKRKKLISLILCVCMLTSLLPVFAFADDDEVRYDEGENCPPHDYVRSVVEPTCAHGGYTVYTCSRCGDSYTADETDPLPHTPADVEEIPATCAEEGRRAGHICSVCGAVLDGCEKIDALVETVITIERQPADAEAGGDEAVFSVLASVNTDEALAYRWQRLDESVTYDSGDERVAAWADIPGANAATLRLTGLDDEKTMAEAMSFAYRCVITAGTAEALSKEARLVPPADKNRNNPEVTDSGNCGAQGDNLTWTLYDNGRLVISGSGPMADYDAEYSGPWGTYAASITSAEIGSGVTSIGVYALSNLQNLGSVSLPSGLLRIGRRAFDGSFRLQSIQIPSSVTTIDPFAFNDCSGLTSITIPGSVKTIREGAFANCASLTSVTIPEGVTCLEFEAFAFCDVLASVTIPESLTTITDYAFENDGALSSVTYAGTAAKQQALMASGGWDTIGNGPFFNAAWTYLGVDRVEYVTLNRSALTLPLGGVSQLNAMVYPAYAANTNVSWASSNAAVAAVDPDGVVTALGVGTATITVTTEDGNYTYDCEVTVTGEPVLTTPSDIVLTGLTLSAASVEAGGTVEVTAEVVSDATFSDQFFGSVQFRCADSGKELQAYLSAGSDGKLHGSISVGPYALAGTYSVWNVQLLYGQGALYRPYASSANIQNSGMSYYRSLPASCDSLAFTVVNNGPQDSTPPVFVSLSFAETASSPGILDLLMAANDDVSGVSAGYVSFRCEESGMTLGVELSPDENGDLRGRLSISPNMAGSVYVFQSAVLFDAAGNSRQLDASALGPNDSVSFEIAHAYDISRSVTGIGAVETSADRAYWENGHYIELHGAMAGEEVFVWPVAANGYCYEEGLLSVSTASGTPVEVTGDSFVMPAEDVCIFAAFTADPAALEALVSPSDIRIEKTEYSYGETIDLRFRVNSPSAAWARVFFDKPDGDIYSSDELPVDPESHTVTLSQYVTNVFPAGDWVLDRIYLYDVYGNEYPFQSTETYQSWDELNNYYMDLSAGDFTIVGTPPERDFTISDLSVGQSTYTYGETLRLQFRMSGVEPDDEVNLTVLFPDGNTYSFSSFTYNSRTDAYEVSEYVTNEWPAGNYAVAAIIVEDANGNIFRHWNAAVSEIFDGFLSWPHTFTDLSAGNFTVTGTPPTGNYKVSNLTVKNASVMRGKTDEIRFKLSGKNVSNVYLEMFSPVGDIAEWLGPATYNKTTQVYTVRFEIGSWWSAGEWRIGTFIIEDKNGNRFRYSNAELEAFYTGYPGLRSDCYVNLTGANFTVLDSYLVFFDANGGDAGQMEGCSYLYGERYALPTNAYVRTGYNFVGWNTEPNGAGTAFAQNEEIEDLAFGSPENLTVLYAQWVQTGYTITYVLNGGTNDPANPDGYSVESPEIVLEDPVCEGYTFAGWYRDKNFKHRVYSIAPGSIGNRVLYARWIANKYTVVFDANSGTGSMKPQPMVYDKAAALTAVGFKKANWHFVGWSEDREATAPTYANKQKLSNLTAEYGGTVTLYAVWVKNSYRIVLNANGGTGDMSEESAWCEFDKAFKLPKCSFVLPGFDFLGWAASAKGKVVYDDEATLPPRDTADGKVVTLYARWTPHHYNIVFNGNGETSGSMKDLNGLACGKTYTLPALGFKRPGYTFQGWNTKADGSGVSYRNKAKQSNFTTEDGKTVTLYAIWTPTPYAITYKNVVETDGNDNPAAYRITDDTIVLHKNLSRPGLTFEGWFLDAKYRKPVAEIPAGSMGAVTLYAKWSGVAYTYRVEFDPNGGSGAMKSEAMICGRPKALTANAFKYAGYAFAGWNTEADGSGVSYRNKEAVLNLTETDGDIVTLYAQWTAVEYKITYKGVSPFDTNNNPATYSLADPVDFNHLNDPERPGCEFGGWYIDAKCTKSAETAAFSAIGAKTLYAVWKPVEYTITYKNIAGARVPEKERYTIEESYELPVPVKDGYVFLGWYTTPTFKAASRIEQIGPGAIGNKVLYAKWMIRPTPDP